MKHDVGVILDTVLSTPGMEDTVKLTVKISRKNLLLLSKLIAHGLDPKVNERQLQLLLKTFSLDAQKELNDLTTELLQKAGLITVHEKLKSLYDSQP